MDVLWVESGLVECLVAVSAGVHRYQKVAVRDEAATADQGERRLIHSEAGQNVRLRLRHKGRGSAGASRLHNIGVARHEPDQRGGKSAAEGPLGRVEGDRLEFH